MRSALVAGFSTSFPRVRRPAVVLLAHDLKVLIVLLLRTAKRLNDSRRQQHSAHHNEEQDLR